ncbi:hypothetical protein D3C85_808950 [compost metagenome]
MIKKQNLKKQTIGIKNERIILWVVISILVVLQTISAWYLVGLLNRESESSKRDFSAYINKSEEERYKHPIVDVTERRVYIPEASVYLPLNEVTRDLRYDYFKPPHGNISLRLSTSSIVGEQIEKDDHTCDKIIMISPSKDPAMTTYSPAGEIQPTKDSLRYISVHRKDTCSTYYGNVQEDLTAAAKLITSY